MDELYSMTAVELAGEIRKKRIGVEELLRAYLTRIEKYDGPKGLNSIAEIDESALENAKKVDSMKSASEGAMFGLPVLVKDNIDVAGLHTTAGSIALEDNVAAHDAPIIANLRRNGAIILGKTNMTEFANYTGENMPGGYSSRGGQVRNAYDREKSPSGSSSGSAVAMSAGFCSAAVGTDTSFSIVGCVTENGVTGLKPTHGSLSSEGIIPIARTLDSAGPITRSMNDALLVYSCMRDQPLQSIKPLSLKRIRLAVNTYNRDQVSEAQLSKYEAVFHSLRNEGVRIDEVLHMHTPWMRVIMRCEFRHDLEAYLAEASAKRKTLKEIVEFYEANRDSMMRYGDSYLRGALDTASGKLDDEDYLSAMNERKILRTQILESMRGYDACIMTGPTNIMHFIGLPSLAIRLGMGNDGTPRGLILYGTDEQRLYAAALTLEKYCAPDLMPQL